MYLNRADQIAEEIQELIFAGSFEDGERLDENRLSEKFGVSRTPLREALKKVALLGIVEKIPNRGVFVHQPGPIELLEMFEVMSELESICGKLAAKRISESALKKLQKANAKCKKAIKTLSFGNSTDAENALRNHVAVQGDKFHQLVASFGKKEEYT